MERRARSTSSTTPNAAWCSAAQPSGTQQSRKSADADRRVIFVRFTIPLLLLGRAFVLRGWIWQFRDVRRCTQTKRLAPELSVILGELLDLDKLICADIREGLLRAARRPPNLETSDLRRFAEPNVLLKRRSAK